MATLRRVKKTAQKLEEQLAELLPVMKEKYDTRTERWQKSQKGKDYRLDIHIVKELYDQTVQFNDKIEHEPNSEEE